MTHVLRASAAFSFALAMSPSLVSARDIGGGVALSATGTLASDYRFRGVSLTNRDPAVQGSVDVSHDSGLYAGVWASNIARYAGATSEVDLYAGYNKKAGPFDFDIGGIAYLYPGGTGADVFELTGAFGATFGPARVRASIAVAPKQRNLVSESLYVALDARVAIPTTPLSLTAKIGRERGSFVLPGVTKTDWSLGIEAAKGPFKLGVAYVGTNVGSAALYGRSARSGVVASVSATF